MEFGGLSTVLIFLLLSLVSAQLTIDNQPIVSDNLYEKEGTELQLECIDCSGAVGQITISLVNVEPSSDPCSTCFQVYQNLNGRTDGRFCLYYLPSQGPTTGMKLDYSRTRAYTASVVCVDSFNNVTEAADIDIRIRTNEPPFFNDAPYSFRGNCGFDSRTTVAGTIISVFPWRPHDPDNDPMFFRMTVDPPTDLFEIDRTTGTIRATRNLDTFCHPTVSFTIYAEDVEGNEIGPYVATCNVDAYVPPAVSNVNKEISLSEDTPVGADIIEPFLRTTPLTPFVTFDVETFPPAALGFIELINSPGGHSLRIKQKLNFENAVTQNFNITLRPSNVYCNAIEHYVYVRTTDANDAPTLLPKNISRTVNEGGVMVNPQWDFSQLDEDFNDRNYFSIIGGNEDGEWRIDHSTGIIYSAGTIDLDPNLMERNWSLLVQVEDLAGETDNTTVTIVVEDINDNRPQFTQAVFPVTVMDCDSPRNLAQVFSATDADSAYRDNNVITYTRISNEFIEIFSDGTAQLKKVPPLGSSSSLSTYAVDGGQVPGPLQSLTQGTVIVTTIPCTTTMPTTQPATVDNNSSSNSNSNSNANSNANAFAGVNSLITSGTNASGAGVGDIILWALAGLLGLLLLAALTYLIWRYCARFCTGSSSWSDGCGCNRAATPRHIRPFSQQRNISRQKEDFKPAKKEIEEEEEEEEVVQQAAPQPPVVYGNTMVPANKHQNYLRVRRLVPVKPKTVKVRSLVPVPNNGFVPGTYRPIPPAGTGIPAPGPPTNVASYQPAPTLPTGQNTKPVQGGVNSTFQ